MAKGATIVFILYLAIGAYFINAFFSFVEIPESILSFDKWIILAGGILILIGGINYLRAGSKKPKSPLLLQ